MSHWDTMLAELGDIPDLLGARCLGRAELFDRTIDVPKGRPRDVKHARTAALDLCTVCPALSPCADWLDALPADQRPFGVVAGRIVKPDPPRSLKDRNRERAELFASMRAAGMDARAIANATGSSTSTVRRTLTERPNP